MIAARLRHRGSMFAALTWRGERSARRPGRRSGARPRAVTYPYRRIELVDATPADGPDPYGDPDPEWLRIDWQAAPRRRRGRRDARHLRRDRRGPGDRLRPRARRLLAELAREHAARWPSSAIASIAIDLPGFGDQPDAPLGDLDPPLRRAARAVLLAARARPLHARRQLDGRLHRRRGRRSRAGVGRAPGAGLRGRDQPRDDAARAGRGAAPRLPRREPRCSSASTLPRCAGPACAASPSPGSSATPSRLRRELLVELITPPASAPRASSRPSAALAGYDLLDRLVVDPASRP